MVRAAPGAASWLVLAGCVGTESSKMKVPLGALVDRQHSRWLHS